MAPVVKALQNHPDSIQSTVCVTGQHKEMLDQVLQIFAIKPDIDLALMRRNQSLGGLTAALFDSLEKVVGETKPDWILAQGDTTTVMVASLVAFYNRVRFGHVEAGLRTGDFYRPFPEEMNRRIADLAASAFFAPTKASREALLKEGCKPEAVHVTGNTVIDALLAVSALPFDFSQSGLPKILSSKRLVLITAHRRESFGNPFRELCHAIRDLANRFSKENVAFVYPAHLNPNVREPVNQLLQNLENVHIVEPVDYLTMVHLMKRAELILTDSGGIQEEAPTFKVPVLVMRDTTERPEGVDAGLVKLVGTGRDRIASEASQLLGNPAAKAAWPKGENPYGDGKAAQRIVEVILESR
jgi:UDP-N-acetylglucosamine 2-epimerase (non-hydrolysing)